MHFPIIKLEDPNTDKSDWETGLDYEDSVLVENTDYFGEMYSPEDRKAVIKSEWMKDLFDGIATINTEKETITFHDLKTIKATIKKYFDEEALRLSSLAEKGELSGFELRCAGKNWRDYWVLFVTNYGMTSMQLIENAAPFYARATFNIGNIFDAHF